MRALRARKWTRNVITIGSALAVILAFSARAGAEYPERPITMIVPWEVGGSTDQTARALAKAAEVFLGQPIVVVNKPGAASTVGMTDLSQANADGYTIGTVSAVSYTLPLWRPTAYDPLKDFTYISAYGENLIGIVVQGDSRWETLQQLLSEAGANPRKIKYGTAGVGSGQHLMAEGLARAFGIKFVHVPQKGSAGSVAAILGGHVDFIMETSVWIPHVEAKKLRLLAVATPQRSQRFPEAPTLKELGLYSRRSTQGIIAPAGLPDSVRLRLTAAFTRALLDERFLAVMKRLDMEVLDQSGEEYEKTIREEVHSTKSLLRDLGLLK